MTRSRGWNHRQARTDPTLLGEIGEGQPSVRARSSRLGWAPPRAFALCLCVALAGTPAVLPHRMWAQEVPAERSTAEGALEDGSPPNSQQEAKSPEEPPPVQWKFGWNGWGGLRYEVARPAPEGGKGTPPGEASFFDLSKVAFRGKFGARVGGDAAAFWNEENVGAVEDGCEIRRARIYWTGEVVLLSPWSFSLEAGMTGRTFTLEESYLVFSRFRRLGAFKLGQFQAPMSLEAIMASRDLTFMESSSAVMALAPGNNTGIQLGRPAFSDRMTWTLGFFANAPGSETGDATQKAKRVMGRLTWLARESAEGDVPERLHLGVSGSHLFAGKDSVRYRSQPENHLAPMMVDTGDIPASGADTLGLEAAWVKGPVSLQGEYLQSWVNRGGPEGVKFWGAYVTASWMVTGESRPYSGARGIFTRLAPTRPFSVKRGGRGALELAARYSVVDLNAGPILGGKMRSLTAGLNWYWNPYLKLRLNWVAARSEAVGPPSRLSAVAMRIELDF